MIKKNYYKVSGFMNSAVKILILSLWTVIMVTLFMLCVIKTVDVTGDMDIAFYNDSFINLLWIPVVYLTLTVIYCLAKRYIPQNVSDLIISNRNRIGIAVTVLIAIFLIWYIHITQFEITSDQMICMQCASDLLKGDFEVWETGYMSVYPFQNGIVFFDALLIMMFEDRAFVAFQYINVIFFIIAVMAAYVTCRYMFKNKTSIFIWIVMLTFYPFAMYVVYCYGTMIGFSFAMLAVMFLFMYFDRKGIGYFVLCGVSMLLSVIIKSNYLIVLVGIVLYLLFDAIVQKKAKSIAGAVVIISIYFLGNCVMNTVIENVTKRPVAEGIPKIAWVAMGLNEAVNTPGWYDNYNGYVYEKNDRNRKATIAECKDHIRDRLEILSSNGRNFIRFFYKKTASQWGNPTWECFNLQGRVSGTPDNAIKRNVWEYGEKCQIYKNILNVVQTLINFGVVMYILLCWKNFKNIRVYELFYAVLMIGAFIFYTFWEAKSQYAAPYYFLIIPYAVMGWKSIVVGTKLHRNN